MGRIMTRIIAGLTAAFILFGCKTDNPSESTWLNDFDNLLGDQDQARIPARDWLDAGSSLCVLDSYAFRLPEGYESAEEHLGNTGFLPVEEGSGILFSVDGAGRVIDITTLSVWPDKVMLAIDKSECLPAESAQLYLRRDGRTLTVEMESRR